MKNKFIVFFLFFGLNAAHATLLTNEFADLYLDCKNKNFKFSLVMKHTPYRGITWVTQNYYQGEEISDSLSKYFGFRLYQEETELVISEKEREPGKNSDKKDLHYYLVFKNNDFFKKSFDAEILKSTGVDYDQNFDKFEPIKCSMEILKSEDVGEL